MVPAMTSPMETGVWLTEDGSGYRWAFNAPGVSARGWTESKAEAEQIVESYRRAETGEIRYVQRTRRGSIDPAESKA
jgi:hypothetical protein